ncbi:MAG: DUF1150 family protein [Rhodospirillales bacterium]
MSYENENDRHASGGVNPRSISRDDLAAFGNGEIAYIRPVNVDGRQGFSIHSADGARLAVISGRERAIAMIRQNALEPVSLH